VAGADWWSRLGLEFVGPSLRVAGHDAQRLAGELGTPLFLYDAERMGEKLSALHEALDGSGIGHRIFYAMKSNRFLPLLSHLRRLGLCGIDACSPAEVRRARQVGFQPDEISVTTTSVSDDDLTELLRAQGLWINCDSASTVRRLGRMAPGREIGLRIDPGIGLGYRSNSKLLYGGARRAKMGIALGDLPATLDLCSRYNLRVAGLHMHCGCGYLDPELAILDEILGIASGLLDELPDARCVNIGGGLGVPLIAEDRPLDLDAWGATVARHFGGRGIEVWVEPGDFVVKDCGVLVCRITSVEWKDGVRFVGVDAGFNTHILPAIYGLPMQAVPCRRDDGAESSEATIAGNINEALDLFAVDVPLPEVREGEFLAFLNAGGYGSSMSSDHCLRGDPTEAVLWR
jgi:diaminopimelate decarboxylase